MLNERYALTKSIHPDLLATQALVYDACNFAYSQPVMEAESAEYAACTFELNNKQVKFRVAKITPTKTGLFVTLWKRIKNGPIQPFDNTDAIDVVVISVRKDNAFGQFIFPKTVLCDQGVMSKHNKGGKRAIRVYPPWDKNLNAQATKSQRWQLDYFLEVPQDKSIDKILARRLYLLESA